MVVCSQTGTKNKLAIKAIAEPILVSKSLSYNKEVIDDG